MSHFKKIAIVGVGLMGGSLALALKERFPRLFISGYCRSETSLRKIKKLDILDKAGTDLEKVVDGADAVVLAGPIYASAEYLKKIYPLLKKGAIVFDLGSTKEYIVRAAAKIFDASIHFVACHPICGSEKSGAQFSDKNLYKGELCFIASNPKVKAVKSIKNLWEALGCRVVFVGAKQHDKIFGFVSHLPHALSFSLTEAIPSGYASFGGPSLKDLTRISASSPGIWADIFISNRRNTIKAIELFMARLGNFKKILEDDNKAGLIKLIKRVNRKQEFLKQL